MCLINIKRGRPAVNCPHYHSTEVVKNGIKRKGMQNFLCRAYDKQFQWEYFYQGANPMVKFQVKSSLLHGSGIRDCNKVYGISPQITVNIILSEGQKVKILPQKKYYERLEIY